MLTLSPVTRIEGHLSIHAETEPVQEGKGFRVTEARCEGEMFRGLEQILDGRDPLDAQQITQRICGVCPISHGLASIRAQEMAYGIQPAPNGRRLQNLILAANYLQSHILHFYHLAALDFVDTKAVLKYTGDNPLLRSLKEWIETAVGRGDALPAAPFLPRFEAKYVKDSEHNLALLSHYVEALEIRKTCHEMAAVFGARVPHSTALVPGGCTQTPTMERVLSYRSRLKRVLVFVREVYLADLFRVAKEFPEYFEVGKGCSNFLCYGSFPQDEAGAQWMRPGAVVQGKWEAVALEQVLEDVACSRFSSPSHLHPTVGQTVASPTKAGAYSWIKSPRYRGNPMEVGPLARILVNYHDPQNTWVKKEVDAVLSGTKIPAEKLVSVLGRHLARGLEALWIARQAMKWLDEVEIDVPATRDFAIPARASGFGLVEAPRGALGHWLTIENYVIKRYQCIVPTTWNCSPRDDKGQAGPIEQALAGARVENASQPIEVGRIVRSFDPCLACAVH